MENSYGVWTKNRYALFYDEEEDPLEVLKVQEQEKEAKKKTKLSEKENKTKQETNKTKPNANPRKTPKDTINTKEIKKEEIKPKTQARPANERNDRNVKFSNETSREERNNKRNREERPHHEFNRDNVRPEATGEGGRGRGRGAVRGIGLTRGRGGMRGTPRGGYDNRGKREFDRQSGSDKTGIKPIDKREGGGAHNWGNHKDDINEQLNITGPEDHVEWSPEKPEDNNVQTETTENKDETVPDVENDQNPPVEEEPRELTLDEYKALRGNRQKPTYNLRKAGEGEDLTQWKTMYALIKKKEGEDDEDDEEEYDASEYPQRVGRQKHILDIDIHFADTRRGMRGRGGLRPGPRVPGGRSGPRGGIRSSGPGRAAPLNNDSRPPAMGRGDRGPGVGADRYGDRGDGISQRERIPRQQQSAPKVDDEHDFPSLG